MPTSIAALRYTLAVVLLGGTLGGGCSQYIDPSVPEPIRPRAEPEFGGEYLLYRPSGYDRRYAWPLIVVCHSSFPDSPNKCIRAWTQLAETHGFLVVAPALRGNKAHWAPKAARQKLLQHDDERHILAAVRHVRAGHNISEERIFIHGRSGGALAAMHTGLAHPEVFRAVALSHPRFDESYFSDLDEVIDRDQSIFVDYELTDALTGSRARRCIDWLRSRFKHLTVDPHGGDDNLSAQSSVEFFEEVLRSRPWIRIRAFPSPGGNPLEIQFKLRCSCRPTNFHWEFGDGEQSALAEPLHAYADPGTYRVTVTVTDLQGRRHRRAAVLKVPEAILGSADLPPEAR